MAETKETKATEHKNHRGVLTFPKRKVTSSSGQTKKISPKIQDKQVAKDWDQVT
jgi:hypothetical protein